MKALDSKLLRSFLKEATSKLKGEWILIGGTLLPAVGLDVRSTVDIDIVNLDPDSDQALKLMELAEQLGLGVETINQAAAFYVHKLGFTKADIFPYSRVNPVRSIVLG